MTKAELQAALLAEREARNADIRALNEKLKEVCKHRDEAREQLWGDVQAKLHDQARHAKLAERLADAERERAAATSAAQRLEHQVEVARLRQRVAELTGERDRIKLQGERDQLKAEAATLRTRVWDLAAERKAKAGASR
jgi:chromosome segregation ATPase